MFRKLFIKELHEVGLDLLQKLSICHFLVCVVNLNFVQFLIWGDENYFPIFHETGINEEEIRVLETERLLLLQSLLNRYTRHDAQYNAVSSSS